MEHVDWINGYYGTTHFKKHYAGKWVVRRNSRPNFEVDFFVKDVYLTQGKIFVSDTDKVKDARFFRDKEHAERFIEQGELCDFHAYQLV